LELTGQAVSRTTYSGLFALLGTSYGAGDGTTTFNIPDYRGRTLVGHDASQPEFDVLGETGGAKTHTLTTAQMPSHTHVQNAHNHTQDAHGHNISDPSHAHTQAAHFHRVGLDAAADGTLDVSLVQESSAATHAGWGSNIDHTSGGARAVVTDQRAPVINASFTGVSVVGNTATNQATTATNQNSGLGEAHNNLQPYTVVKWIICAASSSGNFDTEVQTALVIEQANLSSKSANTPLSQNYIINGGMDIWQRGTSVVAGNSYTADRFTSDSGTVSRQAGPPGIAFSARVSNATGNPAIRQAIELPAQGSAGEFVVGSTWTVSFFARTSTSLAANLGLYVAFSETVYGDPAAVAVFNSTNIGPSTSAWVRYTRTFTVSATPAGTARALVVVPYLNSGAFAGDFFITGVQLEAGTTATPFRRNAPSLQAELAACQRYFQSFPGGVGCSLSGVSHLTTGMILAYSLPTPMRISPTLTASGLMITSDQFATDPQANVSIAPTVTGSPLGGRLVFGGFTGLTIGRYYSLPGANIGSGSLTFSAEL
jgi:microcystin-dependent protein